MSVKIEPLDFELNPHLLTEGFTQSEMQTWDNCPEMWYLRYNLMLQKKGMWNWDTCFGSWMHAWMEEFYTSKGKRAVWNPELKPSELKSIIQSPVWKEERKFWEALGEVTMRNYANHYKHDFDIIKPLECGVELILETEFEGYRLKGMIDLPFRHLGRKINLIADHKSCKRIDKSMMMGWDFRFQFMFYMWLFQRCFPKISIQGFMPNAVRKCQLQWKPDKEALPAYIERANQHMLEKPDEYFYRDIVILKAGDMEHFEQHILKPKLHRIRVLLDPEVPKDIKLAIVRNKNTDTCVKYGAKYACQFLDLCQRGFKVASPQYKQRAVKHTELDSAIED